MDKTFDIIVFGATGFTGRLVAEYLHNTQGTGGDVTWAMAGRSREKLSQVRDELGISPALPLLVADANDPPALLQLVARARVVITTVGPYQRHGQALVDACAQAGTDYVDLCGEPGWMAQMIPRLQGPAAASGARIVFSCGFDSIPFDLGVVYLQHEAMQRLRAPLVRVHGRVKVMKGGFSGGTAASLLATLETAGRDPTLARTLADPFALTPGFRGPQQPDDSTAAFDELAQSWSGPFVMAPINTKNVHRTHALRGHPWGTDFTYSERMLTGGGTSGEKRARALARNTRVQNALLAFGPTRALIRRFALPQPGQGPTKEQREKGRYEVLFIGQTADGRTLRASVKGDRDPGYGSTCKLISETALCLAREIDRDMTPGGVWTPGAAMGLTLVRRLQERAGLTFQVLNEPQPS
ncbi:saccharopine dehydrogenase family protein [Hydrogenophaga sp. PBL-H3]|uniref:saccharopine dehydrogenase family protein n=1 Tax=Hydrogenophaga sp. PBL-H3 TaxID=434010 RepID=UPI0013201EC9|nr:saccharopine dehydrogenase NADP-binding domain-containing protein [Hydrogenophaga sp. PBL-H3]QHE75189.1 NAD(P)H-binding protein [Hydrogenophaga sp. PBL-H3]QHE79616.1 NAD(P)H-binding protein [Hydrogenophaga sp. PBL-H3]